MVVIELINSKTSRNLWLQWQLMRVAKVSRALELQMTYIYRERTRVANFLANKVAQGQITRVM